MYINCKTHKKGGEYMNKRNGWAVFWLLPLIVIIIIIIFFGVQFIKLQIDKNELETVSTNLLQIQGKARMIFEKYHINNENALVGEKQESILELEQFGIEEGENYYKWNEEILNEQMLTDIALKEGEYYLVNYETEEVIFSTGYKAKDGTIYYKLSEIKNLGDE